MEDVQSYWLRLLKKYAGLTKWKPQLNKDFKRIKEKST